MSEAKKPGDLTGGIAGDPEAMALFEKLLRPGEPTSGVDSEVVAAFARAGRRVVETMKANLYGLN